MGEHLHLVHFSRNMNASRAQRTLNGLVGFRTESQLAKDASKVLDLGLGDHPIGSVGAGMLGDRHNELDDVVHFRASDPALRK